LLIIEARESGAMIPDSASRLVEGLENVTSPSSRASEKRPRASTNPARRSAAGALATPFLLPAELVGTPIKLGRRSFPLNVDS
jgi:hypothetical protein